MTTKRGVDGLIKAGEIPLIKTLAKKYAPTRAKMKLLDQAAELAAAPDDVERAYMARELVQCTLPHSEPKGVNVWQRKSGWRSLVIQSGYDDKTISQTSRTSSGGISIWAGALPPLCGQLA
jgi:hypothetical protein